jgi:hypothetical protein
VEKLSVEGGRAVGLTIRFAGRTDYFVQAEKQGTKLRFLDFETDAQAAYVRLEKDRCVNALLAGGTGLTRAGKPVESEVQKIQDLSETNLRHVR